MERFYSECVDMKVMVATFNDNVSTATVSVFYLFSPKSTVITLGASCTLSFIVSYVNAQNKGDAIFWLTYRFNKKTHKYVLCLGHILLRALYIILHPMY